ncbi:hypothetical protein [Teichococcus vastitatis]|uniref:Uncharacterized protein n=1 Tax=Teichococcus vastitatis TaxID=2307076 RepID=A0ABS9WCQ8_9PROT|nr:hypothetical protein [Pseudoroseomonas vastitatis]MCI0757099.1 hypothetical protein [Pseudoroseomonas vastitatis]
MHRPQAGAAVCGPRSSFAGALCLTWRLTRFTRAAANVAGTILLAIPADLTRALGGILVASRWPAGRFGPTPAEAPFRGCLSQNT